MNDRLPQAGDIVRAINDTIGIKAGELGVINGKVGSPLNIIEVTWNYSAFRGKHIGDSMARPDDPIYVSCSGGPGAYIEANELVSTNDTKIVNFWKWEDLPRADGGIHFELDVPVWDWNPLLSKTYYSM